MKVGTFITLSHVNGVPSIHGIIDDVLGNALLVKSITELKISDKLSFDAMKLAVQNEKQICFYNCSVKLTGKHQLIVNILSDVSDYIADGRKDQIIPLFIDGLCIVENQGYKIPITLLNLSVSGSCFVSIKVYLK